MLYKMTIAPQSSIGTPFRSDTLFGHACWAIRFNEGDERLEEFLKNAREQKPELIFSDGFPSGFLPKPQVPVHFKQLKSPEEVRRFKNFNKLKWIKKQTAVEKNWNFEKIFASDFESISNDALTQAQYHNVIDRMSGTTSEDALFTTNAQWFFDEWEEVDIYIYTDWEKKRLGLFVENLFSIGYGKDQTTGSGKIKIVNKPELIEVPKGETGFYLVLSRLVPDSSVDLEASFYDIEAKHGKVWNALETMNPFKKPIMQIIPGSVIKTDSLKLITGRVLEEIADDSRVIENCFSILYPLPKEVFDE
ncbi:MAG TPA: hypothetical protein PK505_04655 [Treponemataceae bacterium]|jgi:CRISPR-associated protein Csm4|nr:hypothetical protein [Treponemataceae bacterium]